MNNLERNISAALERKSKNFNWLSKEIGYTRQGLMIGLANKKLKVEALENIAKVLNVNVGEFFNDSEVDFQVDLDNFFDNKSLHFISKRIKSFYDKLNLYKDVFIWRVLTLIVSGEIPSLRIAKDKDLKEALTKGDLKTIKEWPFEVINEPYSNWDINLQTIFKTTSKIPDAFYYRVFSENFLNINDLLHDNMITDKEIIEYDAKLKKK